MIQVMTGLDQGFQSGSFEGVSNEDLHVVSTGAPSPSTRRDWAFRGKRVTTDSWGLGRHRVYET
jgi:hypothetical protein